MDRPKELERALRQSMVGLTKWSGEPAMEPVFLLAREGNYREATAALMQMVADRTVVVHRWHEHVLLRAAIAYEVDPAPLRDAQTLPDWPHLEDFGYLLDHVIDWLEDRLPDGEAEHMRETHRCGEGGMVVSWLATCIAESNIEITRAEQQAIQMLRYEADIDWFKYRVAELRPHSYGTSGGIELTDEVIERLAEEAEQGYPIEQLPERPLDPGAYDWRGTSGLCGAENLCHVGDDEIEVVCDEETGHPDDHIDNERGFSWSKEEPPTSLPAGSSSRNERNVMDDGNDPHPTPAWVKALLDLDAFYEHPVQGVIVARAHGEVLVVRVLGETTVAEAQARFRQEVQDLKAAFGRSSDAYWRCFDSGVHTFNNDGMCACGYRSPEVRASDRRRLMERLRGSDALMSVRDMADYIGETPQYVNRVLVRKPDFPAPMTDKSGNTRIWFEDDVVPWLDDWQYRRSLKDEPVPPTSLLAGSILLVSYVRIPKG